mgnify:CR=1 FL=1
MKTIKDIDIKEKKVLIRCDFNVPLENGKILDDTRIKESLETIKYCLDKNCKIILLSHLGRIKEESDKEKNNLKPIAKRLEKLLDKKVKFIDETRGKKLETAINKMVNGDIILIQNTRYEDLDGKKESTNDEELGKYWASLGEVFINDAFGTLHRAHASNVGIATYLPSAIGLLIEKELNALSELNCPENPFIVILGGSKVEDKIGVIKELVTKADKILIGGGMAFTFLEAEGFEVGNSIVDKDNLDFCIKLIEKYPEKIILPVDVMTSKEYSNTIPIEKDITDLEYDDMGLDIGTKSTKIFKKYLKDAKMVLWNGPLGVYEFSNYKKATTNILKYLAKNNIKTILGGGDIVAAASISKTKDKLYHASTGGGATLEYLEGKELPGLKIIK